MLFFAYFKIFMSKVQIIIHFLGDNDVFIWYNCYDVFQVIQCYEFQHFIFFGQTSVKFLLMYCIDTSSFPLNIYVNEISTIFFTEWHKALIDKCWDVSDISRFVTKNHISSLQSQYVIHRQPWVRIYWHTITKSEFFIVPVACFYAMSQKPEVLRSHLVTKRTLASQQIISQICEQSSKSWQMRCQVMMTVKEIITRRY